MPEQMVIRMQMREKQQNSFGLRKMYSTDSYVEHGKVGKLYAKSGHDRADAEDLRIPLKILKHSTWPAMGLQLARLWELGTWHHYEGEGEDLVLVLHTSPGRPNHALPIRLDSSTHTPVSYHPCMCICICTCMCSCVCTVCMCTN